MGEAMTPEYPKDHKPGMAVTKGGSSCANCRYLKPGLKCGNEYFVKWNGGEKIPTKSAETYCSDWWEPAAAKKKTAGEMLADQKAAK